jgi:hypothetical protein
LSDGSHVEVEVRLHGYGAKNGMLVLSDYRVIEEKKDDILAAGFGYSCYGPVPDSEISSLEAFDDMLSDWGRNEEPIQSSEPMPLKRHGSP